METNFISEKNDFCYGYRTSVKVTAIHFINTDFARPDYRKNSKNWDTLNYHRDCPTNGIVAFYSAILRSKDSDRITNRVDTDQTAP